MRRGSSIMNNTFDIYVDSAANLTDEMVASTGIKVISFTYSVNGQIKKCYDSSIPFKKIAKEYYEQLRQGADIKTSLVCEADFTEAMTPSLENGRDVLLITITRGLSGTYAQALKAQATLKEKYPDRGIYVIDSCNASLGEGMLALGAAHLRDMGESAEVCAKWAEDNRYKINSYVTVNDLKYLRKSGRVSTIVAVAGTILNIKPMLKADGGSPATLAVYAKERGRKKSIDALLKAFTENVINPEAQTIAITHCDCEDEANELAERLKALGAKDIVIEYYDLCTGSHVGPGTIALFFTGKDRLAHAKTAETQPKGRTIFQRN